MAFIALTTAAIADGLVGRLLATLRRGIVAGFDTAATTVWLIELNGRSHGVLRHDGMAWRVNWFDDADPRLVRWSPAVIADPVAAADALTARVHAGNAEADTLRVIPVLAF